MEEINNKARILREELVEIEHNMSPNNTNYARYKHKKRYSTTLMKNCNRLDKN